MAQLYRELTIDSPERWQSLAAFVKANARGFIDAGTPLRIILTTSEAKRSNEANGYYWKAVLTQIADQAWCNGRQYSRDVWHEHFAQKHMPKIEIELPTGEIISRRKSTTECGAGEFSDYVRKVEAEAAQELGVRFTA